MLLGYVKHHSKSCVLYSVHPREAPGITAFCFLARDPSAAGRIAVLAVGAIPEGSTQSSPWYQPSSVCSIWGLANGLGVGKWATQSASSCSTHSPQGAEQTLPGWSLPNCSLSSATSLSFCWSRSVNRGVAKRRGLSDERPSALDASVLAPSVL